ncbi:MAG TPA: ROK family protein [Opitutaceae bacterium]|jgi:predicted NBD/HSP70 family sugar kinase|nr:ROK family protein [Opitutaceae bacterium]
MIAPTVLQAAPAILPPLDPDFLPAAKWNHAYRALVAGDPGSRPAMFALERPDGISRFETRVLAEDHPASHLNARHAERLIKSLLWQQGAHTVFVGGAPELGRHLAEVYSPGGARAFDYHFMGEQVYRRPFAIRNVALDDMPPAYTYPVNLGRHTRGCRVGFDLGGSERKVAATLDGRTVYTGELPWKPYFQTDPNYHFSAIDEAIGRAARYLPRVDAIGGAAAGIYVDNEVRVASLFRGVSEPDFERRVRRIFFDLKQRWGNVPFEVANDGDVAALAGSIALGAGSVLGISMGTSQAGGFVTPKGSITPWLNELAFSPVDYRRDGPQDEWSGDRGCGVSFFSQQGVARFAAAAGFDYPAEMSPADQTTAVQSALAEGDPRAERVYDTLGVCFGYALAHYAEFYEFRHVLVFGGVTAGPAGGRILESARAVLRAEYPELADQARLHLPEESLKRHGQAIAAATLPQMG